MLDRRCGKCLPNLWQIFGKKCLKMAIFLAVWISYFFPIRIFSKVLDILVLQLRKGLFRGNQNACSVGYIYTLSNRGEINTTVGAKMLNHQSIIELSSVA